MVTPTRELAYILFPITFTTIQPKLMAHLPSNTDIDIDINMIRGRSTSSSQISFKESSTQSAASSIPYHKRIEIQNNLLNENEQKPVERFGLSYASGKEQKSKIVSKTTNNSPQKGVQHVHNETLALNNTPNP